MHWYAIRTLPSVKQTFMYALVCYQDTLENNDPCSESESFSCLVVTYIQVRP
jgi:hypothetical protein